MMTTLDDEDKEHLVHIKLMCEHIFDNPIEVPFGFEGILYRLSKVSSGYCLTYITKGQSETRRFITIDDVFNYIEKM